MKTEKVKMLQSEFYMPPEPELVAGREMHGD